MLYKSFLILREYKLLHVLLYVEKNLWYQLLLLFSFYSTCDKLKMIRNNLVNSQKLQRHRKHTHGRFMWVDKVPYIY